MTRLLVVLLALGPGGQAAAGAKAPPSGLERCRAKLKKSKDFAGLQELTLKAPGTKRVVFVRQGVKIIFDYHDLVASTQRFLKKNGPERFPEERRALEAFAKALRGKQHVAVAKGLLSEGEQRRMDYRIADLLDAGRLELVITRRGRQVKLKQLLVLKYSYYCGKLCAGAGRRYYLPSCELFFSVTDWVS